MKIRRWIWRALQISTVVTAVANAAVLFQHPFAEPYVVRAKAEAELALDRAIRKQMTPAWVAAELDHAVKSEDLDRAELLLELVEHPSHSGSAIPYDPRQGVREPGDGHGGSVSPVWRMRRSAGRQANFSDATFRSRCHPLET